MKIDKLYFVKNQRDNDILDLITVSSTGRTDVWCNVHIDFTTMSEEPAYSSPTLVPDLAEELNEAGDEPVEVVLLTRARYNELVDMIKERPQ